MATDAQKKKEIQARIHAFAACTLFVILGCQSGLPGLDPNQRFADFTLGDWPCEGKIAQIKRAVTDLECKVEDSFVRLPIPVSRDHAWT